MKKREQFLFKIFYVIIALIILNFFIKDHFPVFYFNAFSFTRDKPIKVDMDVLYRHHTQNNGDLKFYNQRVQSTGIVKDNGIYDGKYYILVSAESLTDYDILCFSFYDQPYPIEISDIKLHREIEIIGTCKGIYFNMVILEDCVFDKAEQK